MAAHLLQGSLSAQKEFLAQVFQLERFDKPFSAVYAAITTAFAAAATAAVGVFVVTVAVVVVVVVIVVAIVVMVNNRAKNSAAGKPVRWLPESPVRILSLISFSFSL